SDSPPCAAPNGYHWIHAYPPNAPVVNARDVGKWLIRVTCAQVTYCWGRVRSATEDGTLGIAAKVSTDWGNAHNPSVRSKDHVICVYTRDYRDKRDVLRVARRLHAIDAVRKQTIDYKPDAFTLAGIYKRSDRGSVAIYRCSPPYEVLTEQSGALARLQEIGAGNPTGKDGA